jgi:hypothetical protein
MPRKKSPVGCGWFGTGGTFNFIGNPRRKTDQPEERSLGVVALVGGFHYQYLMLLFYCTEKQVLHSRLQILVDIST